MTRVCFIHRRIGHAPSRPVSPNDNLFVNSPDKTSILSAVKFSGTTSKGLSVGFIQSVTANEFASLVIKMATEQVLKLNHLQAILLHVFRKVIMPEILLSEEF